MVSLYPARRCTSPLGVVPFGLGDGVGDCHDAANPPRERLFISPLYLFSGKNYAFFQGVAFYCWILLGMLVAKREPTPCYRDAHSVGTLSGHFWEKGWQNHCKTTVSPLYGRLLLVSKRTIFFFWGVVVWMPHIGRARHPGPGKRFFTPGQLSVEFVNVGGWLTYGDLALDSCAQFLAVAEHRLIPSRSAAESWSSVGLVSCMPGSGCRWSCWSWGYQSWRCPLSLPSLVTPEFQEFFKLGRVSSYWKRRSGSSLCCLWVSGSEGGC